MSEFDDKLGRILNDPQAMREIMDMAAAFRARDAEDSGESSAPTEDETGGQSGIDPEKLSRIMRIAAEPGGDDGASLLRAIRPYLNPRRQAKFGDALSVMRMARLIPRIKKEGLF